MKDISCKKFLLLFPLFLMFFTVYSCDGIFPSQSKPNVPPDHTRNIGGALHKGDGGGDADDDCNECHGSDLRGQVYNYNGTLVITSSCYQCHGNVWENGVGNKKSFNRIK